jgi:hypothetical protein
MFAQKLQSSNRKFSLYITIKCARAKKFRVWAEEFQKQNSKYADREIVVEGERTIHFNFPVSPQALFIGVLNSENPEDKDFSVDLQERDLITYNVWLDSETRDFLSLAVPFSQISGFSPASEQGRVFTTDDKEFTIKYFDVIRDQKTGQPMSTPARIGHKSGIIETAKVKFDKYTIPYNREGAILEKEGTLTTKKNPLTSLTLTCVGQDCCDGEMVYDKAKNKCIATENFGNVFENMMANNKKTPVVVPIEGFNNNCNMKNTMLQNSLACSTTDNFFTSECDRNLRIGG